MSAEELFKGSGKTEGVEIWRIEKLKPVKQALKSHGSFFSGDSYIVLYTKIKNDKSFEWHIHFWLGKDSSKDEQGAAAILAVELDDYLGGGPIQHREVQGHESQLFASYFRVGIQIYEGGIDSAFNHVDPDKYTPRLFHLKGKRDVRINQVKLSRDSLNEGDVFILDAGMTLYQWNGVHANKYEKFKGLELITQIRDQERGGKPELIFLDQGVNDAGVYTDVDAEPFWKLLGGRGPVKSASDGGDDEFHHKLSPPSLWKISDGTGKLKIDKIAEGKLQRSSLDSKDVFMVDTSSELFLWIGRGSTKNEKSKAMEYAIEYLSKNKRPDWCPITRLVENAETPVFKSLFAIWDPPMKIEAESSYRFKQNINEKKSDFSGLYHSGRPEEDPPLDDGKGKTTIWRVENLKLQPVPKESYGQFYGGDSYVVLYEYEVKGKPFQMLYFWQGRDSTTDEKTASAILTVEMDNELTAQGKDPTQVRVVMGKEPNHFLSIFKGKFIVHAGGIASGFKNRKDKDSYDTDGVALFHVRGTTSSNVKAIQVPEKAISLNSNDVFVLSSPKKIWVWHGKGATADERKFGESITSILAPKKTFTSVEEGSEEILFWDTLGGKTAYPSTKEVEAGAREPRLFHGSNRTGSFLVEEIFNFNQDDLDSEDVFLLDVFTEVFVWVGSDSNAHERREAFTAALEYVKTVNDGRDPESPVLKVDAGKEPPLFTMHFHAWDDSKHAVNMDDPYLSKLRMLKGEEAVQRITHVHQINEYLDPATYKFSVAELQDRELKKIDPKRRHQYLSEADFKQTFGCSPAEFENFPEWKKKKLRIAAKLF